jgi:hypothetical protein
MLTIVGSIISKHVHISSKVWLMCSLFTRPLRRRRAFGRFRFSAIIYRWQNRLALIGLHNPHISWIRPLNVPLDSWKLCGPTPIVEVSIRYLISVHRWRRPHSRDTPVSAPYVAVMQARASIVRDCLKCSWCLTFILHQLHFINQLCSWSFVNLLEDHHFCRYGHSFSALR